MHRLDPVGDHHRDHSYFPKVVVFLEEPFESRVNGEGTSLNGYFTGVVVKVGVTTPNNIIMREFLMEASDFGSWEKKNTCEW